MSSLMSLFVVKVWFKMYMSAMLITCRQWRLHKERIWLETTFPRISFKWCASG